MREHLCISFNACALMATDPKATESSLTEGELERQTEEFIVEYKYDYFPDK